LDNQIQFFSVVEQNSDESKYIAIVHNISFKPVANSPELGLVTKVKCLKNYRHNQTSGASIVSKLLRRSIALKRCSRTLITAAETEKMPSRLRVLSWRCCNPATQVFKEVRL